MGYRLRFDKYGDKSVQVHEFSVVDENVILGRNVKIEPFCIIESGVEIRDNVIVPPYSHIRVATVEEIKKKAEDVERERIKQIFSKRKRIK